jgi:hypothetical protein
MAKRKRPVVVDEGVQAYEVSARVTRQASLAARVRPKGMPRTRRLRVYTLDPSLSFRLGGLATAEVPYEALEPGPRGALFDVRADGAPAGLAAGPLDLDDRALLLADGVTPSPADGRFHLQMAYAVCATTYEAFRRALGRDIAWAMDRGTEDGGIARLVVRPFGAETPNAGFSRETGDLSFGHFLAGDQPAGFVIPRGRICTVLSHDIIAHETTHALLDALRASFDQPTNVDVLAFHEGFADLVALFLHFAYPEVVAQAIRESRGRLRSGSLLVELAREFGYARSKDGSARALRSGIDVPEEHAFDADRLPGETDGLLTYAAAGTEPHRLGSVLVSAVFEAFVTIVRRKSHRLFLIAGLDPQATERPPLSEPLVQALAEEASAVASQFLNLCIRAIDYCPPVDIRLGEYLRALITADTELESRDKWGYREALMRAFRRRQIFPEGCEFMTEDAVRWLAPPAALRIPGLAFKDLRFNGDPACPADRTELERQARALGEFLAVPAHATAVHLIPPTGERPAGITYVSPLQIQSIRVARRTAPDGRVVFDLVAEVTQSATAEQNGVPIDVIGGVTLVIDPEGEVRYAIHKSPDSESRQARQRAAVSGPLRALWRPASGGRRAAPVADLFRRLHDDAAHTAATAPPPRRRRAARRQRR